jgi:hypothetical protein
MARNADFQNANPYLALGRVSKKFDLPHDLVGDLFRKSMYAARSGEAPFGDVVAFEKTFDPRQRGVAVTAKAGRLSRSKIEKVP